MSMLHFRAGVGVLTLAALLSAGAAQADAPFDLAGLTDSGPLPNQPFVGGFAYDASAVAPGFSGDILLTGFVLTFAGQTYTLASADAAPTAAFADGVFLGLSYADADSADAALRPNLAFVPGFFSFDEAYFAYESAGGAGGFGSYGVSAVPEPAGGALLLAGLGLVGAMVRSRLR